jgi:hypothetical protein
MKTIIEVEITNIEIDDFYFSFDYVIKINSKEYKQGQYESDHAWADDKKAFKKLLKDGDAVKLALEDAL